jgi:hypothetical protein
VKFRSHFDQATHVSESPLTLHSLGISEHWWFDTTFWPFIHLLILLFIMTFTPELQPMNQTSRLVHRGHALSMSLLSHHLATHTTLLPLSAPIPKQYSPTFYVTPFR